MSTNDTSDTTSTTDTSDSDGGGEAYDPERARQQMQLAAMASALTPRHDLANGSPFDLHGGDRELWEALGYKKRLTYSDYRGWYDRGGIAKTIIEKPPAKTWEERPDVVDDAEVGDDDTTDFEEDVAELFDASDNTNLDRGLRHYLERVDKLGRIGRYSVLYLGFRDADSEAELATPVDDSTIDDLDDLLFATPLGEDSAEVEQWVDDATDPRNGLPETYTLDLANGDRNQSVEVHHSRVIHVAEGVIDDDVHGEPALRACINRLFDLEKTLGASAEAYWMVSNPGLALSVDPELEDIPTDKLDEQVDEYEHNLRRVLKMYGTDVEQLESQDVDPEGVVDALLKIIAGTVEIPQRKLVGSERGELASSQDEASFNEVISARQTSYAEPVILRPLLDRLIEYGILDDPRGDTYSVEWPSLFQLTELEEAELLKLEGEAVRQLSPMNEPDMLHSVDALREHSPIDEPDDASPPGGDAPPGGDRPEPDETIDESDEEVADQFEQMRADHETGLETVLDDEGDAVLADGWGDSEGSDD